MKKHPILLPLLLVMAFLAIAAFSLAVSPASAGELPPRPETPTPPSPTDDVEGAPIILLPDDADAIPPGAWTVVQWQTALDDWADVDGWQGHFERASYVQWWVGPEHFGESPFRWLVYDGEDRDTLLATSDEFTLPEHRHHTVIVPITLPDPSDS
ncbi:MAG TPA: hypothetical protein VK879_13170 [Candidatus Sulfomarinibacteraceae bacterium]|nr:hypothetical protein [Candidatus Sulfomarinibacteraceae bacterium]